VVIATKVGFFDGLAPDKIASACDSSLERLGVETSIFIISIRTTRRSRSPRASRRSTG
jgi:Predicted oxidoreductases (related to aryl-alcohol dehydrogenases)